MGGKLHGVVKSGNIPLPGVTVTAANSLTGKRYSTTTDVTGAWSMTIPQNGRYVVRTQFAAFAQGSQEALLNAASHDQAVSFDLMLASRAAQQEQQSQGRIAGRRGHSPVGRKRLAEPEPDERAERGDRRAGWRIRTGSTSGAGASLPSIAGNSDFGGDSVAISGQSGSVSPLAGVDMDRLRDAMETFRAQNGGQGGSLFSGLGGGGFGGGPGGFGGPGGGFGGGGFGGGRMNFRNFKPGQPHGAIFWTGSNSSLNAEPFALRGQEQEQPASGTNRFGLTFIGAPYIPRLTKPSGKDTVFLTLSGQRSSTPSDQYATVPTEAEREGNIPGAGRADHSGAGRRESAQIFSAAQSAWRNRRTIICSLPRSRTPRRPACATCAASAPMQVHSGWAAAAEAEDDRRRRACARASTSTTTGATRPRTTSISFPQLGGKQFTDSNSLQAGYTIGYHKITSIFNSSWNRNDSQTTNFFTKLADISTENGVLAPDGSPLNTSPLNFGLPNITLNQLTGTQRAAAEPSAVADHLVFGDAELDSRQAQPALRRRLSPRAPRFSGRLRTRPAPSTSPGYYTGSSLGDFLLGKPQETSIDSAV